MNNVVVVVASAALVVVGGVGCSSEPAPFKPARGVLRPGTAYITVDGERAATSGAVRCAAFGSLTTIEAGDESSGATVMVSGADRFTVKFVRIRNLNGFTGDYNLGLDGDAAVALTDATYHITGTALGYSPKSIEPTTRPFKIEVAC
jgi:lipoprotein LpqH